MKRNFITTALLFVATMMLAVPAKRGQWRTITLEDGSTVKVELRGDEYVQFYQAEDGRCFRKQAKAEKYYQVSREEIGKIATEKRTVKQDAKYAQPKKINLGGDHQPYVGTKKCLCILMEFPNKQFQPENDIEQFRNLVNGIDYVNPSLGHVGSVRDYFRSQSNGVFDIDFDVVGPYMAKNDYGYYGEHSEYGNDAHAGELIREAVEHAAHDVTFSDYDWDGDGYVEPIFVLYAGKGEADGGDEDTIWPHKSGIQRTKKDGVYITDYACGSELNGRGHIDGIGTMCHEYSHCLGLPDMYDTQYGTMDTPGAWDIMDSGCYNGNGGDIPAGYTAYERWYAGWLEPTQLTEDCTITGMQPLSNNGNTYVVYNDAYPSEYYLLENRKREGWDAGLPGEGLLITHVDFDFTIWAYNLVNTYYSGINTRSRYTVIHAGNSASDRTDPYPYNGVNALTNTTVPSASLFHYNPAGIKFMSKPITNITKAADGTISFDFADETDKTAELPEGVYFIESFSMCNGKGGNDNAFKPTDKSVCVTDMPGWEADDMYGGYQCAYFGSSMKKGLATSPEIDLSNATDSKAEVTFRAVPYGTESHTVTLSIGKGSGEFAETSFELQPAVWKDFSTTVTVKGLKKIKINFEANAKRFFLDEVVVKEYDPTGITEVKSESANGRIYNLAGQQVTAGTKGITISNGKKYFFK